MLTVHKGWQFESQEVFQGLFKQRKTTTPQRSVILDKRTSPAIIDTPETNKTIDQYVKNVRQGKGRIIPAVKPQSVVLPSRHDRRLLANRQGDTIQERQGGKPPENIVERQIRNAERVRNWQKAHPVPVHILQEKEEERRMQELKRMLAEK